MHGSKNSRAPKSARGKRRMQKNDYRKKVKHGYKKI